MNVQLVDNWQDILKKSYAVKFIVLGLLFQLMSAGVNHLAAMDISIFGFPEWLAPIAAVALSILAMMMAPLAVYGRVLFQKGLHDVQSDEAPDAQ